MPGERWALPALADVARAQAYLLSAWWVVRSRRRGELIAGATAHATTAYGRTGEPDRIALGVDRAARFGVFRPTCLVRSIALRRLLERAGVASVMLRVGVRWREGSFDAHAWIEVAGRPIGRDGRIAHMFDVVDDIEVVTP
jgi:hypothetical protein